MIGGLATLFATLSNSKALKPVFYILLAVLAVMLIVIGIKAIRGDAVDDNEVKIEATIERSGRAADQAMAEREATRWAEAVSARKEFNDATIGLPDEGLSCRQRIDVCGELHDAGIDTSLLPECINICAGSQAGAQPQNPARQ